MLHPNLKRFLALTVALCALATALSASAEGMILIDSHSNKAGISSLQRELIDQGYLTGSADGVYGDTTVAAVEAYAADRELGDARADADMIKALFDDQQIEALDVGSTGSAVYAVQRVLWIAGFLSTAPDGKFGEGTKSAAKAYMQFAAEEMAAYTIAHMPKGAAAAVTVADELPDVEDERVINAETVVTDGTVNAEWLNFMLSESVSYGPTLKAGDTGDNVKRMQKRLKALNYLAAGTDGNFGTNTIRALKYFQKLNNLAETGELDDATKQAIYSETAVQSNEPVSPYKAYVDTEKNRVYIFQWNGEQYKECVKTFICSCGRKSTPTIKGTFQATGHAGEWYHMVKSGCWVRYAYIIDGGYFFHSVLFSYEGDPTPTSTSVNNLGSNASHGCVRLAVEDAKWIYENCLPGMTVVIK